MKIKKNGFTVVEILTTVTIIAILVGILIPSITAVRKLARNTQQTAQLTTIALAISAFKNDYGDYPPSSGDPDYSGSQKLTEALVGWDLMGFHPDSAFNADGEDDDNNKIYPERGDIDLTKPDDERNLEERMEIYLENHTDNVFRLGTVANDKLGIFEDYGRRLEGDTYVICDVFKKRRIALKDIGTVKAGTPILYYKANTASKHHDTDPGMPRYFGRIYNVMDNKFLVDLGPITEDGKTSDRDHPLAIGSGNYKNFYEFIRDKKIETHWPYRPDSYLLISAGADGEYGTEDDITNFK